MSSSPLKNKRSTYIMLPLTLGIWGFVGYKVYTYLNEGEENLAASPIAMTSIKQESAVDSFVLFNNYRDPFLGNEGKELNSSTKSNNVQTHTNNSPHNKNNPNPKDKKNQPAQTPQTDQWPKIVYNGMIANSTKNQMMAFISIDGASKRVNVGDKIGELRIVSFNQNEIILAKGKEKKVFGK